MKAMICTQYGPAEVLQLAEVEKPAPKAAEVLVRINATSVTSGDCRIRGLNVPTGFGILVRLTFGFRRPRKAVLGMNLAGVIESVGDSVNVFKVGDQVFGTSGMNLGAYAEYICLPENSVLAIKPKNMSDEQAAALPFGTLSALSFLRDKGKIESGQNVLIYGASGSVGSAAVQLARYFGATVTAVCSAANVEMVKELGAQRLIDYNKEDFTQLGEQYDIVFDTVGKTPFAKTLQTLKPNGRYLLAVAGLPLQIRALWTSLIGNKKVIAGVAGETKADLEFLKALFEAGKLKPVIDRCYAFEQIPEAHQYVDSGHKKGNVVIMMEQKKHNTQE